jgi:Na+/H+-dicarboxylate symporter
MQLWQKVFLGMILGIIFGMYFPQYVEIVRPIGVLFLRLIKMVIVPLLFFTLVSGLVSVKDPSTITRIAKKSVIAYFVTTCFAVIFGLGVAYVLKPGEGIALNLKDIAQNGEFMMHKKFDFMQFFVEIVPDNIFAAFTSASILQVVFFSIFTGVVLNSMDSSVEPIKSFIHAVAKIVLKMIGYIVQFSHYGAFSLTAWVVGTQGVEIIFTLGKLVNATIIAFILQYIIFGFMIMLFCRLSPIPFYRKSIEYQMIALSTGSSKASLATTMQVCRQQLGISETNTAFVLPLGASMNMNGLSLKLGLSTVFFAQMLGVSLSWSDYMMITIMGTVGSIGGAGIPGSFIVMLPVMLESVGLPAEGVAFLVAIDRVLDMVSTAINITGDATITLLVDSSEGTLDKELYNS